MNISKYQNLLSTFLREVSRSFSGGKGSVLVYLIVVILIFGILGATMVSLFTTATTSSATPNDARRAYNLAESGTRYAFSELRDNEFEEDTIIALNSTTYNVADAGSFTVNVFSPWFESQWPSEQNNSPYRLKVPEGTLTEDFNVPTNSTEKVWAINFEYLGDLADEPGASSPVTAYTRVDDTTLRFNVSDDFNVSTGERVCLGVKPDHTQALTLPADLYVERMAKDFFPRFNGAININRVDYSYDRLVDEPGNNRVKLENLTASRFQNTKDPDQTVEKKTDYTGNFIVLSPRNHMVISTGVSGPVSYGGEYKAGMDIYETSEIPALPDINANEFTSNLTENETSSGFISVDTDADTLNIGGGITPGDENAEFGAGWYNADKSIGGTSNVCQAGACEFRRGIRVFFVLKFIEGQQGEAQQGDGLTFTLMNAKGREVESPNNLLNGIVSVGGDYQRSELMGYAGDSRTEDDGFLDPTPPRGIQPPKLAIEFDTRTNFDAAFESEPEPKNYCIDSSLRLNTRNDPLSNNEDAVQYVFWGDSSLNVPCRSANPSASLDTYDDNRHGTTDPPINDRNNAITYRDELVSRVIVDDFDDWLNGSTSRGPWAIRIEIEREDITGGGRYTIQTWIRQCGIIDAGSPNCTDTSIIGIRNPFQQTRLKYNFPAKRLYQQIELTPADHAAFGKFFFGFTGAAGSEALDAEISQFQLSIIRF